MAEAPRAVSVLIAALGGQGGGVLTEWLVGAAAHAGYPAQATSIPGVAQRTGATTYYVEVFSERASPGSPEPVFSLYPTPGDVDVIIGSELLEAARTLEMDYASPERTTLIASTHRLFAIGEKTVAGDGVFSRERLVEVGQKLARRMIGVDALAAARRAESEVNAVLLGVLAASRVLPMEPADFEAAIREGNVAVARNLAGFKAGLGIVESGSAAEVVPPRRAWTDLRAERAAALGGARGQFDALADRVEAEFPAALHRTLGEAVARLIDYQGAGYAQLFLERVRAIRALDPGTRLTETFARCLAVWMSYEDAIRVADLKTRRGRFDRIRAENGVAPGQPVVVTDYLKPDLDEIYGILPAAVGAPIARWAERRWPDARPTLAQHVKTTTVLGFLRVWGLGRLRVLRRSSLRYRREFALIDRWERAVRDAAPLDVELACAVAELAGMVKGYGEVRRRLSRGLAQILDETLPAATEEARRSGQGYARAAQLVTAASRRSLDDESTRL